MNKKWTLKKRKFNDILAQVLCNRGIATQNDQNRFLMPQYERDVHDPFLLRGMKKAVRRIEKAIAAKENIGIFGDYDVDGICGSIILHEFFEKIGVNPFFETYLPDRTKDGYGLNRYGLTYFKDQGATLVITVDCGITDHTEIAWAQDNGIDVIVTDHHEVSQGMPPAFCVVNPKQKNDRYPFSGLAGTGVAFKLAQALRQTLNHESISEAWEKWLLDLVAFATVADQMPLIDENRALVKYGLLVMAKTRRLGLRALMGTAGLNPAQISTQDLLYQLAPRVNAASRMDHAQKAFTLLTANDPIKARLIAMEIDTANKARQTSVAKALAEVQQYIDKHLSSIKKEQIIFAGSTEFSPGVCGLVANKLVDRYGYPTFIYSASKDMVKGSVRSLPPFSVVNAMKAAKDVLLDWGGHHQAGGFSLEPKNLKKFHAILIKQTAKLRRENLKASLEIDAQLQASEISLDLWDRLQELEPFGKNNPEPVFLLKGAIVYSARKVGQGQDHFKLALQHGDQFFEAIYFNGVSDHEALDTGQVIDVAFYLKRSTWGVRTRPELHIIDLKNAD